MRDILCITLNVCLFIGLLYFIFLFVSGMIELWKEINKDENEPKKHETEQPIKPNK